MALALLACALAASPTAQAQSPVIAQATDDEDETPPPRGLPPEAPPEEANDGGRARSQMGSVRRPNPFNLIDEAPARPHPTMAADPNHDVVVCEAGCDGPRGIVVYKRKKLE